MRKILFIIITLIYAGLVYAEDLAIIVNPSNTETTISANMMKQIILGDKKRWSNGKHIVVFLPVKDSVERKTVDAKVMGMSAADFEKYLADEKIRGNVIAPPKEMEVDKIKSFVAQVPNAVGIIPVSKVDAGVKKVGEIKQ